MGSSRKPPSPISCCRSFRRSCCRVLRGSGRRRRLRSLQTKCLWCSARAPPLPASARSWGAVLGRSPPAAMLLRYQCAAAKRWQRRSSAGAPPQVRLRAPAASSPVCVAVQALLGGQSRQRTAALSLARMLRQHSNGQRCCWEPPCRQRSCDRPAHFPLAVRARATTPRPSRALGLGTLSVQAWRGRCPTFGCARSA